MLAVREQQDDVALSKTQRSIPANARPATPDQDEARSLLVERMQSQYEAHSLRPLRRPVSLRESATKKLGLSFKHIRLYGGLVDISTGDTHASLPFSSTTMQDDLAILHHLATRRMCASTEPSYPQHCNLVGYRLACAILTSDAAWHTARAAAVVQLLARIMQDCFAVSQQARSTPARHAQSLLLVVEDTWTLFWELLKQHPQSTMTDLCQAKVADWLAGLINTSSSSSIKHWAAHNVNRLSYYMHTSGDVMHSFLRLYPQFLQSNPAAWQSEEEQTFLLRLSSAVLSSGGMSLFVQHMGHVLGFCGRLVRLELAGSPHMGFLLEYFVISVLLGQVSEEPVGAQRLQCKDVVLALTAVARTKRKDVAAAVWALLALPLYRTGSVWDMGWWGTAS